MCSIHNSQKPLSARMTESMASDPLAPILWEPHLAAMDRRLQIVLYAVQDIMRRSKVEDVIIVNDFI